METPIIVGEPCNNMVHAGDGELCNEYDMVWCS